MPRRLLAVLIATILALYPTPADAPTPPLDHGEGASAAD